LPEPPGQFAVPALEPLLPPELFVMPALEPLLPELFVMPALESLLPPESIAALPAGRPFQPQNLSTLHTTKHLLSLHETYWSFPALRSIHSKAHVLLKGAFKVKGKE
jgi:hypothetical protein